MANETRLIDANALMDEFRKYIADRHDRERCVSDENCNTCERECLWRRVVKAAPTVDAVEVVQCKDCKYCNDVFGKMVCTKGVNWRAVEPKHFCSYGERREGE